MMDLFLSAAFCFTHVKWWYIWCIRLLVDVFISCLDSHSDDTHSLHRIHVSKWCKNLCKFLQICPNEKTNSYILDGLKVSEFSANFYFWVKTVLYVNVFFLTQPRGPYATLILYCSYLYAMQIYIQNIQSWSLVYRGSQNIFELVFISHLHAYEWKWMESILLSERGISMAVRLILCTC